MPKYKQKITKLMDYAEFKEQINDSWNARDRAFLEVLFFSGCRISEALALTANDIQCDERKNTLYVHFFRLKGSKQVDPIPLPRTDNLEYLCTMAYNDKEPFAFSRTTGWRIVKRIFPKLYPHYFRMNRITKISNDFSDGMVYSWTGICAQSIDHYRGKSDITKLGKALQKELQ